MLNGSFQLVIHSFSATLLYSKSNKDLFKVMSPWFFFQEFYNAIFLLSSSFLLHTQRFILVIEHKGFEVRHVQPCGSTTCLLWFASRLISLSLIFPFLKHFDTDFTSLSMD